MLFSLTVTSLALETTNPVLLVTAALASQLPDVDTSTSFVGRILWPLSRWLENRFPHRTLTHSLLATAIIAVLALPLRWQQSQLWYALMLGYFSGWFGDAFTKSGVAAFYPLSSARLVIPANPRLRLTTGSRAEYVVCAVLLLSLTVSFQLHTNGGLRRTFNALLAQPEGVTALFAKASATHQILAHIEGRFIASATSVNAEFEVLEVEGEKLLVREANGLLYWAEQESACTHCHLAIHRVQVRLGLPIRTSTKELKWQEKELQEVVGGGWLVTGNTGVVGDRWSVAGKNTDEPPANHHQPPTTNSPPPTTVLFSGELTLRDAEGLQIPSSLQHFNPVEVIGNTGEWTRYRTVRLRAATLKDLEALRHSFGSGNLIVKFIRGASS
ncbi:MAG: metal-dependent hydrolase [Blastocatellia bacterium]|nr:metal-dependent hydrolase [Blastocatellia bacterium]